MATSKTRTAQDVHPIWHTCARVTRMLMANPALHTVDQVPDNFKESYILSGYRSPRSSPWQCLQSAFAPTNETLNFWTHFLPALYFCWQTELTRRMIDTDGEYAVPLFISMITVCIFPIMSSVAHIFNTMSDRSRHICFFLDYSSIGLYIYGTAIAYRSYVFPTYMMSTFYSSSYLYLGAVLGVASLIVACETRFLPPCTTKKIMRMLGFMLPYFYLSFPLMCRVLICEGDECSWFALPYLKRHFFFAFLSAVFFGTHMPERFYPGRFDIVGHSHQLFHLCSVISTRDQVQHLLQDMRERQALILATDTLPSTTFNVTLILVVVLLNIAVLSYYIAKIYRYLPADGKAVERTISQKYQNNNDVNKSTDGLKHRAAIVNGLKSY